ncbi:hypothetical protein PQX77_010258 [Marasmius sp. AFHP31]|nr:hypothetical protein PQX77_010258 [Marasmius sp. AFHP31]
MAENQVTTILPAEFGVASLKTTLELDPAAADYPQSAQTPTAAPSGSDASFPPSPPPAAANGMMTASNNNPLAVALEQVTDATTGPTRPDTPVNNESSGSNASLPSSPSFTKFAANWGQTACKQVYTACVDMDARLQKIDSENTTKLLDLYNLINRQSATTDALRTSLNAVVPRADQITGVLGDIQAAVRRLENEMKEQGQEIRAMKNTRDSTEPARKRIRIDGMLNSPWMVRRELRDTTDNLGAVGASTSVATLTTPPLGSPQDPHAAGVGYPATSVTQQYPPSLSQYPVPPASHIPFATPTPSTWPAGGIANPHVPVAMAGTRHPSQSAARNGQPVQAMADSHPYHIQVTNMVFKAGDPWGKVAKWLVELVPAGRHCSNRVRGQRNSEHSFTVMFGSEADAMAVYNDWVSGNAPQKFSTVVWTLGFRPGQSSM